MHVLPSRQKAFPFGEGVGSADRRGYCLPLRGRCRLCRRKRSLPSPLEKVSALPTEEVIAFPFGEGVGIADGRGLYGEKCPPLGGVYLSFELNWEECRCRETLLSIKI